VFHVPQCDGNDVYELSVDEIQHLLSTKAMTSVSLVKHCLERIRRVGLFDLRSYSPLSEIRSIRI
jgi:amidase